MKNFNFFLILLVMIGGVFLCTDNQKRAAELTEIEVPNEIIISDDSKEGVYVFKLKISYKYSGDDLVSNNGSYGPYSFTQSFRKNIEFYYFDKTGNVLPDAYQYQEKDKGRPSRSFEAGGSPFDVEVCLKNGNTYHYTCPLFPSPFLKHTELLEAIKKRKLDKIQIIFTDLVIVWKLADGEDRKRIREGKFFFNIEKEFWIDVKYADAK